MLGENIIAEGSVDCPNCGENLEFDFSELSMGMSGDCKMDLRGADYVRGTV